MDKLFLITLLLYLVIIEINANPHKLKTIVSNKNFYNNNKKVKDLDNSESSLSSSLTASVSPSSLTSLYQTTSADFGGKAAASYNSDSYANSDYSSQSDDYYNNANQNDYDHSNHDGSSDMPSRPQVETGFKPFSGKATKKTKKTVILAIPVKLALKVPDKQKERNYGQQDDFSEDNNDYRSYKSHQQPSDDDREEEFGEAYAASRPPKREHKKKNSINKIIKGMSSEYELASPVDIAALYDKPRSAEAQKIISTFMSDYLKPNDNSEPPAFKLKPYAKNINPSNMMSLMYSPPLPSPLMFTYPAFGSPLLPVLPPYPSPKKSSKKKSKKIVDFVLSASSFTRPFKVFSRSKGDKPRPFGPYYSPAASSPVKFYVSNKPKYFHPGLYDVGFNMPSYKIPPIDELFATSSLVPTLMKPQKYKPVKPPRSKVLSFYKKFF